MIFFWGSGIDPVQKITLAVSDLQRSVHYWSSLLGMKVMEKSEEKKSVLMGFSDSQVGSERQLSLCDYLLYKIHN